MDTGVFDEDRYFDVIVEYAKAAPEDILVRITAHNHGPDPATLHLLPTVWFRNTWSWGDDGARPVLRQAAPGVIALSHPDLGERFLAADGPTGLLFTENETNTEQLVQVPNRTPYVKDAFHRCLVHGQEDAVNPAQTGTKAAAHYQLTVPAGKSATVRLRMGEAPPTDTGRAKGSSAGPFGKAFDTVMTARRREADEFYASVLPAALNPDGANVARQGSRRACLEEDMHVRLHHAQCEDPSTFLTGDRAQVTLQELSRRRIKERVSLAGGPYEVVEEATAHGCTMARWSLRPETNLLRVGAFRRAGCCGGGSC
jgi:hypothetical protein